MKNVGGCLRGHIGLCYLGYMGNFIIVGSLNSGKDQMFCQDKTLHDLRV